MQRIRVLYTCMQIQSAAAGMLNLLILFCVSDIFLIFSKIIRIVQCSQQIIFQMADNRDKLDQLDQTTTMNIL